jgi:hypothetical protein
VILFLSVVVLVLVGAVVMILAMLGELSSRVPAPEGAQNNRVEPVETARAGHGPDSWPTELAGVADHEYCLLLVLSASCSSCATVADQFSTMLGHGQANVGIVVVCPVRERGEHFAAAHGIDRTTVFYDKGGAWSRTELGIDTSPTAVLFHNGRVRSAMYFWDLPTVFRAVGSLNAEEAV